MSDNLALAEQAPPPAEQRIEEPLVGAESVIESGDISGVYKIARNESDLMLQQSQKISNPEGMPAGPEIVALRQADATLQNETADALNELHETINTIGKPDTAPDSAVAAPAEVKAIEASEAAPAIAETSVVEQPKTETEEEKNARLEAAALKAMSGGPLTLEDMSRELQAHEAAERAKTRETVSAEVVPENQKAEESDEPEVTITELSAEESKALEQEVAEAEGAVEEPPRTVEQIKQELLAQQAALADFQRDHTEPKNGIEAGYIGYLTSSIAELQAEKDAMANGDETPETKAKLQELKAKANEAKVAYENMLKAQEEQHKKKINEDQDDYNYQVYQPHSYTGPGYENDSSARPQNISRGFEAPAAEAPKKGFFGRIKDVFAKIKQELKFWRII